MSTVLRLIMFVCIDLIDARHLTTSANELITNLYHHRPHTDNSVVHVYEDADLNFTQLVSKYGYRSSQYNVITEDGYILTLFRMRNPHVTVTKGPVLLVHGLLDSADSWVLINKRSWGYILSDAGYDVWMVNLRGNSYSRRHLWRNPDKDPKFWEYGFHEMGVFDLAANIDFVLQETGVDKLIYIGHSMGTTVFYVLCSMRPEYNDKIRLSVSLAPIAFMTHAQSVFPRFLSLFSDRIYDFLIKSNVYEVAARKSPIAEFIRSVCTKKITRHLVCLEAVYFMSGAHDNFNDELVPVIFSHFPNAMSTQLLENFGQALRTDKFCSFDHGPEENMKRYNRRKPVEYKLKKVTAAVAMYCGTNDYLSSLTDAARIRDGLANVVEYHVMSDPLWTHFDYTWGKDFPEVLVPKVLRLLEKYS